MARCKDDHQPLKNRKGRLATQTDPGGQGRRLVARPFAAPLSSHSIALGDLQAQLENIFKTTVTKENHQQALAELKQQASLEQTALQRQVADLEKMARQVSKHASSCSTSLTRQGQAAPSTDEDAVRLKSDLLDANMRLEAQQLRLSQLERQLSSKVRL